MIPYDLPPAITDIFAQCLGYTLHIWLGDGGLLMQKIIIPGACYVN